MPHKKRNKQEQKTCTRQNKILKKRLMQISICVDNYIYKHKPISVEEAKMYAEEISLYKTQCTGNVHILQVIDKLTRCMKSIIEETINIIRNLNNNSNEKKEDSIDIFFDSPENINIEETKKSKKDDNRYEVLPSNNIVSKNVKPRQVVFKDCEKEHITNVAIDATSNEDTLIYDLSKLIIKCPADETGLGNIKETTNKNINTIDPLINTNNILKIEKYNIENTEKCPLKTFETPISLVVKDHLRSNYKEVPNTIQLNLNQTKMNVTETTQSIHDKNYLTHKCLQTTKCDLKATATLEKNLQRNTANFCHFDTKNKKQKNNIRVTETTHNTVNNARKEKKSTQRKPNPKKNKEITAKKSSSKEKIKHERKQPKVVSKNKKSNSNIPNKFKHTNVHIKNDEVSITACNSNRSKNIKPHMTSHTCNKSVEIDLSWVNNIKYVREVSADEFDPKLNGLEDTFWDNFSLPGGWSDIEFLY